MRNFLARFRRGERESRGAHYRSRAYAPLRPWQVRGRRFRRVGWFGRRGLDPDEVQEFLDRVATDLTSLYDELAKSRDETIRVKAALRQWQSRQSRTANVSERY
ncbi:DivIVA domain-containing protein [Micromonospora sp. NBC_01699]|uniref:DivIVA domain-containing protein n=1 Tax=Micromonospora sp. NBC_01699 TaxID=2975984 RepID=UPI002E3557EB|nr:DivIVA domain-containing protein [Micromonospora sp. NBC_01699]